MSCGFPSFSKSRISDIMVCFWGILWSMQTSHIPQSSFVSFFAKITQKLARTANAVVLCITDNALDVGSKLFLAYFPYLLRDDNSETIFPRTRVTDIRCLAAGNEVDDVAGTQIFRIMYTC